MRELFAKSRVELELLVERCIGLQSNRKELEESVPRFHSYPCPCISCPKHVMGSGTRSQRAKEPLDGNGSVSFHDTEKGEKQNKLRRTSEKTPGRISKLDEETMRK